jgi:hypothetical protein
MTDYSFVSSWRLQAPIDQVWEEIFHTERWPSWWKYRRHRGARERWPLDTYPCRRRDARPLRLGVRTTR